MRVRQPHQVHIQGQGKADAQREEEGQQGDGPLDGLAAQVGQHEQGGEQGCQEAPCDGVAVRVAVERAGQHEAGQADQRYHQTLDGVPAQQLL